MSDVSTPTVNAPASNPPLALSKGKRKLRLLIGLPLMAVVWYFVIKSLVGSFRQIEWKDVHVDLRLIGLAVVALVLARLMNGMNCALMLRSLGQRVGTWQTVPIIWVASLGRYVPGKMVVVAGATFMLMRLGVRMPVALAGLFLSTSLMILMGLMTSTPFLLTPFMRDKLPGGWIASLAVLAAGMVCLHPRIFTRLCNLALVKLKRQPLADRLIAGPFLVGVGITAARNLLLGLGLWLTVRALAEVSLGSYPLALGSTGLASVAGFLAVFASGGLGIHEAIYLVTLTPLLGEKTALLVVIFRFLHLLADALTGGAGMLIRMRTTGGEAPVAALAQEGT